MKTPKWTKSLWTDETWVKDGRRRKTRMLRRAREVWDEACVEDNVQRRKVGCFGCISWEYYRARYILGKDWRSINGDTYREHTVPLIAQYLRNIAGLKGMENGLDFMQDYAPGHAAKEKITSLEELAILTCKSASGGVWYWNRYPSARVDTDAPSISCSTKNSRMTSHLMNGTRTRGI